MTGKEFAEKCPGKYVLVPGIKDSRSENVCRYDGKVLGVVIGWCELTTIHFGSDHDLVIKLPGLKPVLSNMTGAGTIHFCSGYGQEDLPHCYRFRTDQAFIICDETGKAILEAQGQVQPPKPVQKKCTCPIFEIMRYGCKCGGFAAEMRNKK